MNAVPDAADEAPRRGGADPAPRPLPPEEPDDGALRLKVLLAGIAALLLAILVIVAVLVATRERTVPRGAGRVPGTSPRTQAAAFDSRRAPRVESGQVFATNVFALDRLTPRGGASSARGPSGCS
jgi:hypothetical protein